MKLAANYLKLKKMKNKQYPPRGGPPQVYYCRGTPFGTRVFHHGHPLPGLTAHSTGWREFRFAHSAGWRVLPITIGPTAYLKIRPSRIDEDVGPAGRFQVPNLEGLGNLEGLKNRNKVREPAWPSAGVKSHNPGSIAGGISVDFSEGMAMPGQRKKNAFIFAGLQPHLVNMRLKPEEFVCSVFTRQLGEAIPSGKQTAMEEKQPAKEEKQKEVNKVQMEIQQIKMEILPGRKNLQEFGNPEGLTGRYGLPGRTNGLKTRSKAREPAGHPLGKMYRSNTGAEGARDGTRVFHREYPLRGPTAQSIPEGLHVYRKTVSRGNSTPEGVAQSFAFVYFYKHLMSACSADRPLASGTTGYNRLWMKAECNETLKQVV